MANPVVNSPYLLRVDTETALTGVGEVVLKKPETGAIVTFPAVINGTFLDAQVTASQNDEWGCWRAQASVTFAGDVDPTFGTIAHFEINPRIE